MLSITSRLQARTEERLRAAAKSDAVELAEEVLKLKGINVNAVDGLGMTGVSSFRARLRSFARLLTPFNSALHYW